MTQIIPPEEFGEHIARLNQESVQHRQRLDWHDKQLEAIQAAQQAQTTQLMDTKALVMQTQTQLQGLAARLEGLDSRLFEMVQQMTRDNANLLQQLTKAQQQERQQERKEGSKERSQAAKNWINFAKYVVGGTIVALITYMFTKGE